MTSADATEPTIDFDEVRDVTVIGAESAIAVSQAVHEIRPETNIQPKYSTNTGVPGVVAGQP